MEKIDALGERMKRYENVNRNYLTIRTPVIVRIDGKAFHTFTKGFEKPFDYILAETMKDTMKYLCENIQGCVFGYTQSDEISLVLVDYQQLDSYPWFNYNIQKCASVSASMATMAFNKIFRDTVECAIQYYDTIAPTEEALAFDELIYTKKYDSAMFDSRVFSIPKEEVCNYVLWRQNDAIRNSIEMVGQANFSWTDLHKKSCEEIKDMLAKRKNIIWDDIDTRFQRGCCCIQMQEENTSRAKWTIDTEIPIFKGDGRKYVDDRVFVGE